MATKSIRLSDGTNTLLPESATSEGQYNLGYQKNADGTLIAYGTVVTNGNIPANTSTAVSVSFPIEFSKTPVVTITVATASPHTKSIGIDNVAKTGFDAVFYSTSSSSIGAYWQAMGRWK